MKRLLELRYRYHVSVETHCERYREASAIYWLISGADTTKDAVAFRGKRGNIPKRDLSSEMSKLTDVLAAKFLEKKIMRQCLRVHGPK